MLMAGTASAEPSVPTTQQVIHRITARTAVQRELIAPGRLVEGSPASTVGLRSTLDQAAAILSERMRTTLAAKPSPWIVKAYDVGVPTDFNTDVPWHVIDKEVDGRFDIPHKGKLGLFNATSDVNWILGVGVDDQKVSYNPPRRCTDHLVNLIAYELKLGEVVVHVMYLPVRSDTVLLVLQADNPSAARHSLRIESACTKPPVDAVPFDRFGYGITPITGKLEWVGFNAPNHAAVSSFDEWDRKHERILGSLLATVAASVPPESCRTSIDQSGPPRETVQTFRLDLSPGESRSLLLALNLHRYGPMRFETERQMVLYPAETPDQALATSIRTAVEGLQADWPALVRKSYAWYERMPEFHLPRDRWAADLACALELPRGNTWSPQDKIRQPWYTFCRVHGNDPYRWWNYGMHGHEHLSTFVTNITDPSLSQAYLDGHYQVQRSDGAIQYGVNHQLVNVHDWLETAPLLCGEAWTAYGWSGDREFLQRAYEAGSRNLAWWRSAVRTREGMKLQHWKDYIESVRDDADIPTWTATGKAENQEALDLNCYLLSEERALAEMAKELGRRDESNQWRAKADERQALMQKHLWHAEDGVFYGRDLREDRWARVMDISTFMPLWCGLATESQARSIAALLHDPQAFGTDYPVATLAVKHMPQQQRGGWHWRGANWVQMTWLVIQGLHRYGFEDEAARLTEINCRMVFDTLEKTGHFREYYNTLTGEPIDLTDYIWTSMPAIMAVELFLGVRPKAEGLEIMPVLPADWPSVRVDNLCVRNSRISLDVRRDKTITDTAVHFNGKPYPCYRNKGLWVPWRDLPRDCQIAILLPVSKNRS